LRIEAGNTKSALENYGKALALNPRMASAREAIRKLRGK
jgi:hypothetical protein